jgi:hypothetical protein
MEQETTADGNLNEPLPAEKESDLMEVHHHPEVHHKKKHFREYFLEFLMIFLAVVLGFLAENLREHISEKERAEVFAQSLAADFRQDTASLHQLMYYTKEKINKIDSLDFYLHAPRNQTNNYSLYNIIIYTISTFQLDNINGTYEQIKNSGSLRFFHQSLVDSLNGYDATSLKLKLMEDWESKYLYEKFTDQIQDKFNFLVMDDIRTREKVNHEMYLRNLDEKSMSILINQAIVIKNLRNRQLVQQESLLRKAEEILSELSKEFH